jgi:hypothetical protein
MIDSFGWQDGHPGSFTPINNYSLQEATVAVATILERARRAD